MSSMREKAEELERRKALARKMGGEARLARDLARHREIPSGERDSRGTRMPRPSGPSLDQLHGTHHAVVPYLLVGTGYHPTG